jgi:hypothetical protein
MNQSNPTHTWLTSRIGLARHERSRARAFSVLAWHDTVLGMGRALPARQTCAEAQARPDLHYTGCVEPSVRQAYCVRLARGTI